MFGSITVSQSTTPSSLAAMMSPGVIRTPAHFTGIMLATLAKRPTALAGEIDRAEDGVYDCERVVVPKSFQKVAAR